MRRFRLILAATLAVGLLIAVAASAKGLLPSQVYRFGLTNAQIDDVLARHLQAELRLTAQDWRAMRYQLHRFDMMTNYVHIIGSTQDCERVLLALHDTAKSLTSTNASLRAIARHLQSQLDTATDRANEYAAAYASATNSLAVAIAEKTSAEARAARLDRLRAWLVEQRDKALLPTTKAIYQAIIDRVDERTEDNR